MVGVGGVVGEGSGRGREGPSWVSAGRDGKAMFSSGVNPPL